MINFSATVKKLPGQNLNTIQAHVTYWHILTKMSIEQHKRIKPTWASMYYFLKFNLLVNPLVIMLELVNYIDCTHESNVSSVGLFIRNSDYYKQCFCKMYSIQRSCMHLYCSSSGWERLFPRSYLTIDIPCSKVSHLAYLL